MAVLLSAQRIHLGFGAAALLEEESFSIEAGERICIVGRNGAGKSSLLKLMAGEVRADDGQMARADGLICARMAQELPVAPSGTVRALLEAAAAERTEASELPPAPRVAMLIDQLKLPADAALAELSGGTQRRVELALALAREPDLLLLDEPTNHLDVDSIAWLEGFLRRSARTLVFITHDRAFLRALATRILEVDRGRLTSWPGDWDNYLRRREERLHAEAQANALFDKKLAQEEAWIRKGIEARRTRSAGRVRALLALRREHAQRRELEGRVQLAAQEVQRSGKQVFELDNVHFGYPDKPIVSGFSTRIQRGDRIGIVGANGSGKTTLLKLLLGDLHPQQGEVRAGSTLQVAYFDQARAALDETRNAADNVADGMTSISTGSGQQHVIGYLQDFLFTPEQARAPIHRLSGGERARLLLARLFARPHNVLVMDEPTNDLDMETLELLEERLLDYPGTVLLVSHDRAFIDNVVTSVIALEGQGVVREYVGGYSDWQQQRTPQAIPAAAAAPVRSEPRPTRERERRLSYKEQKELDGLPAWIEQMEQRIASINAEMAGAGFFRQSQEQIREVQTGLARDQQALEAAYARWEELEALRA